MDVITINVDLTLEDWRVFQKAAAQHMYRTAGAGGPLLGTFAAAAACAVTLLALNAITHADLISFAAGVVVWIAVGTVLQRLALRRSAPEANGVFLGPCEFTLDSTGLHTRRANSRAFVAWDQIREVTRTATHVFVWLDRISAYTIPARDLPNGLTPDSLASWISTGRADGAALLPSPRSPGGKTATVFETHGPRTLVWLSELAGLIALRGRTALSGASTAVAAVLTTLLAVGTWLVLDRWASGPDTRFFVYGMSNLAWYLLGGFAVAWVLARTIVPRVEFSRAAVVVALGAWLAILGWYIGNAVVGERWFPGVGAAGALYGFVYLAQAARGLTGDTQPRAACLAFFISLAFLWLTGALFVQVTVWVPPTHDSYADEYRNAESLLFAQHDKVEAALASVQPNDPATTEMFFVGFAGNGFEKVFPEEIKFAARTVGQRYGTDERSVLLLNDMRDTDTAPLATLSALRYALRGIAAKMALDDDILFLALSSHGSHDWTLSVSNGALPLADIRPEDLAGALAGAGIKWRVIVISACYAGGFIDALQDPDTIVLAAAAPDRTSFGCSNDRDLTYFGEAFYRDSLPTAASLRDAFTMAKQRVRDHETEQGIHTPSEPTASFGEKIELKLAAIERAGTGRASESAGPGR